MVETINVPEADEFQLMTEHSAAELVFRGWNEIVRDSGATCVRGSREHLNFGLVSRRFHHPYDAGHQGNHHAVVIMHVVTRFRARDEAPLRDDDPIRFDLAI